MRRKERTNRAKYFGSFLKNGHKFSTEQQQAPVKPYEAKEVKQAIFSIDVNNSLGPDGYGSGLYREAWNNW